MKTCMALFTSVVANAVAVVVLVSFAKSYADKHMESSNNKTAKQLFAACVSWSGCDVSVYSIVCRRRQLYDELW